MEGCALYPREIAANQVSQEMPHSISADALIQTPAFRTLGAGIDVNPTIHLIGFDQAIDMHHFIFLDVF